MYNKKRINYLINTHGKKCKVCCKILNHKPNDPDQATVDHVIPISRGGKNIVKNLQLLCRICNTARGETLLNKFGEIDDEFEVLYTEE